MAEGCATAEVNQTNAFDNNGARIFYDDFGSGKAVLFIHGHPFNRTMWHPQVQSLRWRYRTICPDLRGYGESSLGDETANTLEIMADDLIHLLDHWSIEKVSIVGLSMGGQIAMELASGYPGRIAACVLAATFPGADTREEIAMRLKIANRILDEGIALIGSEILPKLIGPLSMKTNPRTVSRVFEMICTTDPAGAAAGLRGRALRRNYRESLKNFHIPCLICVGADDRYTTVEQAQEMRMAIPNSRLEILPGIGHMPNLEDEDRFNRLLHEFLETCGC